MYTNKKKERLYIQDIIENPPITYPMYYIVSSAMKENEMLHEALYAIHLSTFENYSVPTDPSALFGAFDAGVFAIYKEQYAVGNFGGKLMYLESGGWKSMHVTPGIFEMENWLI